MIPGQDKPTSEFIDLDEANVLKEPRDPTKHRMTGTEAKAYQTGQLDVEYAPPKLRAIDALQPQQPPPQVAPAAVNPPPVVQPTQVPAAPQQALLSNQQVPPGQQPAGPPVQPQDSQRVQNRINRLYGQMRTAEEERDAYAQRLEQLEARMAGLSRPADPGYRLAEGSGAGAAAEPAGEYVSRAELQQTLTQVTQAIQQRDKLADSQFASRSEAERDFAPHFANPEFRSTYDTILARDGALRADPDGPYKAAIMARGMFADAPLTAPAGTTPDTARRQILSGVGPSVPEGAAAQPDDRVTRYNQALAYARSTGRDQDFVRALLIKNGQA
jgi:hypothetical protein